MSHSNSSTFRGMLNDLKCFMCSIPARTGVMFVVASTRSGLDVLIPIHSMIVRLNKVVAPISAIARKVQSESEQSLIHPWMSSVESYSMPLQMIRIVKQNPACRTLMKVKNRTTRVCLHEISLQLLLAVNDRLSHSKRTPTLASSSPICSTATLRIRLPVSI